MPTRYRTRRDTGRMPLAKFRVEMARRGLCPIETKKGQHEQWRRQTAAGKWVVTIHGDGTCDLDFKGRSKTGTFKGLLYGDAIGKLPHLAA